MSSKLIECPSCGKEVAKNAKVCPHCGNKLKMGWFLKIFIFFIVLIIIFIAAIKLPSIGKEDIDISTMQTSNLKPTGEIVEALSLANEIVRKKGSIAEEEAHDKELKERRDRVYGEYNGKIVQWKLKVSSIEKDDKEYEITTSRRDNGVRYATTSIIVTPKNDATKKVFESIKPKDYITFKGKIFRPGLTVDLVIDPAILISVNGNTVNNLPELSQDEKAQKIAEKMMLQMEEENNKNVICKLTNLYDEMYNEIEIPEEDITIVFEMSDDEKIINVLFDNTQQTYYLFQDDEYDTIDNSRGDRRRLYKVGKDVPEFGSELYYSISPLIEVRGEGLYKSTIKENKNYIQFGNCKPNKI